jgi:hypothetical protein
MNKIPSYLPGFCLMELAQYSNEPAAETSSGHTPPSLWIRNYRYIIFFGALRITNLENFVNKKDKSLTFLSS